MSATTAGKSVALNALALELLTLHSGFPGNTGANEVTGGAYAPVACTFSASAAGSARTLNAPVVVNVPATTVGWAAIWNAAKTVCAGYSPNGGDPKEFQVDAATDTVRCPAHGYANGQTIVFYGDTTPSPLTEGQVYYARDCTTDTFKVAASSGGAAIDLTTGGSSACVVSKITLEVYGGAGTHTIQSWSFGAPH